MAQSSHSMSARTRFFTVIDPGRRDASEALGMRLMFTNDFNAILKTNRFEQ